MKIRVSEVPVGHKEFGVKYKASYRNRNVWLLNDGAVVDSHWKTLGYSSAKTLVGWARSAKRFF